AAADSPGCSGAGEAAVRDDAALLAAVRPGGWRQKGFYSSYPWISLPDTFAKWSFKKVFKFWDFLGILSPKGGPMARKRIEVTLTPDEHESLSTYVAHGHKSAREINRARILLLANDGHTDADIAKVLGVSHVT